MSDHLAVFDTTLGESHLWLKAVAAELSPCDQHQAYLALRATLHVVRDRLNPDAAMHVAAQLPLLLRGVFTEGWRPSTTPSDDRHLGAFLDRVERDLPDDFPIETESLVRGVLRALVNLTSEDIWIKVLRQLPAPVRSLWPSSLATL